MATIRRVPDGCGLAILKSMKHDVIIIGAGPNGLAAALALGGARLPRPLRVFVLDGRDPRVIAPDTRGTALTLASQNMFKALGVWDELAPHAAEMRDIIVTDSSGSHEGRPPLLSFATEANKQAAACIIENAPLNAALLASVDASPLIALKGGFAFESITAAGGKISVRSASGEEHSASLVVAADGRQSPVRQFLGIDVTRHDYGQTALSFSIEHSEPHHNRAEEHFSPDGVFAVLPLPGNNASIVWGMSPGRAAELMALDDADFSNALKAQMGDRLGRITLKGKRGAFPLFLQIAKTMVAERVALLGDAAHAIHPLAGLGLNLGFKDSAALADCVAQALARGEDIGSALVLARYEQARRFDTLATSLAMEVVNALFVNDNPLLKFARDAGLKLVDRLPFAKDMLMQQAANTSQDNPRLLRGLLPG